MEIEYSELGNKIACKLISKLAESTVFSHTRVGIMLNITNSLALFGSSDIQLHCSICRQQKSMGIIKMICCIAEGVNFEPLHAILGYLIEQPIDDQTSLYAALAVEDEDDLFMFVVEKFVFNQSIRIPHVLRTVTQVTLHLI